MGLLNYLTFDSVDSSDYGVFISGKGAFNAPARRGEMVSIPGRDGSLFMDEGSFENIEVSYPAFIGTGYEQIFRSLLASLRSELTSRGTYKRLTDTYNPDEFRLAVYRSGLEVDPKVITRAGEFTIKFDCKPQRFLVSGEVPQMFTANGVITNPTPFASSPLIRITGNGLIAIGNYRFIVSGTNETITIDSDLMEVFIPADEMYELTDENGDVITDELLFPIEVSDGHDNPVSMNRYVEFNNNVMPKIEPGEVPVRMTSGIRSLEIVPRWWRL